MLCKQLLIFPQAANLKIEKRSMLQNTPQEFFTSVLTPAPARSETRRSFNTCPNRHWQRVNMPQFTHKNINNVFFFHSHFLASCWSLDACEGEKAENRGVSVCLCVIDNERTEGLLVRGSLCWPVKELESESTIQTPVGRGLPHTRQHKRLREEKQTRCTEKLLRAVKVHSCVFFHKEVEKHFRV